jgi:hypothetical protein
MFNEMPHKIWNAYVDFLLQREQMPSTIRLLCSSLLVHLEILQIMTKGGLSNSLVLPLESNFKMGCDTWVMAEIRWYELLNWKRSDLRGLETIDFFADLGNDANCPWSGKINPTHAL